MIRAINQYDLRRSFLEPLGGCYPAKAAADDDNAWGALRHIRSRLACVNRFGSLGVLSTQLEKSKQHFIPRRCQLVDGTPVDFLESSFGDGFSEALRPIGEVAEVFPPGRDRTRKMIHEMLNTALAATEMKQHVRPHDSPAQSRTPAHGRIRIRDVDHT